MCDERQVYERYCTESHERWSAALEQRRHRRGLVVEFVGPNWWGTGQVLLTAVDIHSLCVSLERYCYVSGYTMRLGSLFGYANGMSWHPDEQTAAGYPNVSRLNLTYRANWKDTRLEGQLRKLARGAANASLIWITVHGPMAASRNNAIADLPLPPNATLAPHEAPGSPGIVFRLYHWTNKLTQRPPAPLTRCFVRFVTSARFEETSAAPRAEDGGASSTVLHLRTGYADVGMPELEALSKKRRAGAGAHHRTVGRWLSLACPTLFQGPRVTVLTDSPAVRKHFKAAWARGHHGASSVNVPPGSPARSTDEAPAATPASSSRSWDNDYGAQLAVARDMATASRATTFYFAFLSSFVQVVTARSMCISELHSVDDPQQLAQNAYFNDTFFTDTRWRQKIHDAAPERRCPSWTSVFLRNMYTDSFRPERWRKIVSSLPAWHPCSALSYPNARMTARRCREEFLAATA